MTFSVYGSLIHINFHAKKKKKYTNPANAILDFCKQKLWPLPFGQLEVWKKSLLHAFGESGAEPSDTEPLNPLKS